MARFRLDPESDSAPVLDRVLEAYGFTQKLQLAEHLGIASSSMSARYKRGGLPADIMLKCMAETGVTLEWLATGQGRKFEDEEVDILKMPRRKIVDGLMYDAGMYMLDKVSFLPGVPLPTSPVCVVEGNNQFIVDTSFIEVYDDQWLVEIEGKMSIRTLTRIPIKKVRVSGVGMAFDCGIDDITVIGRVVLTIK
ncbi:phage repressor protein CI [Salmonella enterica subsp. enterica serovar Infantis]|uniref:Phage repressor protein n=4 Tax=Salmonella enterica TaxID=28901 RepID=A0A759DC93_SALER|nr:phage repressor protein CI [Salmonella enterica]EBH8079244.1 transcriptional regulator [Salmonella bongori]EBH8175594.1 transcriptional regulator [Salmonella enterica subsp. enterica serovar Typhimurium str. UK-1]ECE0280657.1 transcriptional regulator [Salmonella enterica subsp. enterica]ECF4133442.1 transcriptional regulator [Salmonella enterica subsp. enterica serovar Infantis]ECH8829884.1 transcriptional regulator [Salmonella enterica subsp. enterica serovar Bovismorbificans]ECM6014049.